MKPVDRAWQRASAGQAFAGNALAKAIFTLGWAARVEMIDEARHGTKEAPAAVPPLVGVIAAVIGGCGLVTIAVMPAHLLRPLYETIPAIVVCGVVAFADFRRWWRAEGRREDAFKWRWS